MKSFFSQNTMLKKDIPLENKISEKDKRRAALLSDIEKTRSALEIAYAGFDNAIDPDLIDCYIFEVNSTLKRYRFLLNQAASLLPDDNI